MAMDDTGGSSGGAGGAGGSQVETLGLNVVLNGAQPAEQGLDSFAQAADGAAKATVKTMSSIKDLDAALENAAAQYEATRGRTKDLTDAQLALHRANKEAMEIAAARYEQGMGYLQQLEQMTATFNMATDELQRYKAAQAGVSAEAEVFIVQMKAMRDATAEYGVVIKELNEIDKAHTEWQASNATALNAQRIRALDDQAKLEESSSTALNAQRTRSINDQTKLEESSRTALNAQRIRSLNEAATAEKAALEEQEKNQTIFQAFKTRTMNENRAEAMRILTQQEKDAAVLAEKQSIEEIAWAEKTLRQKVAILERLKAYQASPNIGESTVNSTFGSAAIKDIENLNAYKAALAQLDGAHNSTAKSAKTVEDATKGLSDAFGNAKVRTEALVLAHEAFQGRTKNFVGSLGVMAEYLSAADIAVGLSTVAMLGLGVAVVGTIYEMVKGSNELTAFNKSMALTANYAGLTRDSFRDLAEELRGSAQGYIGKATDMINALASSGKVSSEVLRDMGKAALEYQYLSGKSTEQVAKFFEDLGKTHGKVFNDMQNHVADWAAKANDQYHFLSAAQYEHIRQLTLEGNQTQAVKELMESFSASMEKHEVRVGILTKLYMGWGYILDGLGEKLKNLGKDLFQGPSFEEQMNSAETQYERTMALVMQKRSRGIKDPGLEAEAKRQLQIFKDAANAFNNDIKNAKDEAQLAQSNSAGVEGARYLDYLEKMNRTQKQVADDMIDHAKASAKAFNDNEKLKWEQSYKGAKDSMAAEEQAAIDNGTLKQFTEQQLDDLIENIKKKHHEKVAKIANDGRKQELLDQLGADEQAYKLTQEAADHTIKMAKELADQKQTSRQSEYDAITSAYNKELDALGEMERAKLATLAAYKPKNDADAAENIKRINEVKRAYQLSAAEIHDALVKSQQDVVGKAVKEVSTVDDKQINALNTQIENQKKFNAEIGKTAEQKKEALAQLDNEKLIAAQVDLVYQQSLADNKENGVVEQTAADKRVADLQNYIDKLKEKRDLENTGAALEAQAALDKLWAQTDKKLSDDIASAIVDGGGKGYKKLIRDMELAFAKMVLQPIISPIAGSITSVLYPNATQATGVGAAGGSGEVGSYINAANAAANAYKMVSTGFSALSAGNLANYAQVGLDKVGASNVMGSAAPSVDLAAGMTGNGTLASGLGQAGSTVAGYAIGSTLNKGISGQYSTGSSVMTIEKVATAVASYFGPEFGAIAGAISGLINRAFGMGNKNVTATGVRGTLSDSGVTGTNYSDWHQDGGWFRSDKSGTDTTTMSAEEMNSFASGLTTMKSTMSGLATVLGVGNDALKDYSKSFDILLTPMKEVKGSAAEQAQIVQENQTIAQQNADAISKFFSSVGDDMATKLIPNISDFALAGETASTTLQRLNGVFAQTNAIATALGKTSEQVFGSNGLDSDKVRESLVNLAGGSSVLNSMLSTYDQNYLTNAEKLAPAQKAVSEAMSKLGLASVVTRDQFKATVSALDLTKASDQQLFVSLMQLQDAFATITPAIDDSTMTVADAKTALSDAYKAESDAIKQANDKMTTFITTLRNLKSSLLLGESSPLTPEQKYIEAKSQFEKIKTDAENGDQNAQDQFQSALQNFLDASKTVNASSDQYRKDFDYAMSSVDDTVKWAQKQVDIGQASLLALQAEVRGLIDINDSVKTVAQAIKDLAAAMGPAGKDVVSQSQVNAINSIYSTVLGRTPDQAGLSFWQDKMNQGVGVQDITAAVTNSGEKQIDDLYQSIFNRAPDAAGLDFWVNAYNNGVSINDIASSFQQSSESTGSTSNAPLVSQSSVSANTSTNSSDVVQAIQNLTTQVVQLQTAQQAQTAAIVSATVNSTQDSTDAIVDATISTSKSNTALRVQPA